MATNEVHIVGHCWCGKMHETYEQAPITFRYMTDPDWPFHMPREAVPNNYELARCYQGRPDVCGHEFWASTPERAIRMCHRHYVKEHPIEHETYICPTMCRYSYGD